MSGRAGFRQSAFSLLLALVLPGLAACDGPDEPTPETNRAPQKAAASRPAFDLESVVHHVDNPVVDRMVLPASQTPRSDPPRPGLLIVATPEKLYVSHELWLNAWAANPVVTGHEKPPQSLVEFEKRRADIVERLETKREMPRILSVPEELADFESLEKHVMLPILKPPPSFDSTEFDQKLTRLALRAGSADVRLGATDEFEPTRHYNVALAVDSRLSPDRLLRIIEALHHPRPQIVREAPGGAQTRLDLTAHWRSGMTGLPRFVEAQKPLLRHSGQENCAVPYINVNTAGTTIRPHLDVHGNGVFAVGRGGMGPSTMAQASPTPTASTPQWDGAVLSARYGICVSAPYGEGEETRVKAVLNAFNEVEYCCQHPLAARFIEPEQTTAWVRANSEQVELDRFLRIAAAVRDVDAIDSVRLGLVYRPVNLEGEDRGSTLPSCEKTFYLNE